MPALTCQLTYRDAWGAAGAWIRVCVASVGLLPVLLKYGPSLEVVLMSRLSSSLEASAQISVGMCE